MGHRHDEHRRLHQLSGILRPEILSRYDRKWRESDVHVNCGWFLQETRAGGQNGHLVLLKSVKTSRRPLPYTDCAYSSWLCVCVLPSDQLWLGSHHRRNVKSVAIQYVPVYPCGLRNLGMLTTLIFSVPRGWKYHSAMGSSHIFLLAS